MKLFPWNHIRGLVGGGFTGGGAPGLGDAEPSEGRSVAPDSAAGMAASRLWVVRLMPKARHMLGRQALATPSPAVDWQAYWNYCRGLAGCLPDSLRMALTLFRSDTPGPGAILIRGLPLDPEPPCPSHRNKMPGKTGYVSEAILGAVAGVLGQLQGPLGQKSSEVIETISPTAFGEAEDDGLENGPGLGFRSDSAHAEQRPAYLLILGLWAGEAEAAVMKLACARDALAIMEEEAAGLLRLPVFRIAAPCSLLDGGQRRLWSKPVPLVFGEETCPWTRLHSGGLVALNPAADSALAAYHQALEKVAVDIAVRSGEMLVIDNRKTVHTPLAPAFQGSAAGYWLQRTRVSVSQRPVRTDPASRGKGSQEVCRGSSPVGSGLKTTASRVSRE